jgi:hypothetical protein
MKQTTSLPGSPALWRLFVLAGSTIHFFAILLYVIPVAAAASCGEWRAFGFTKGFGEIQPSEMGAVSWGLLLNFP